MIFDKTYQSLMAKLPVTESVQAERTVIILRAVSGTGKSTFASVIAEPKVVCTADDHFEQDGEYKFNVTQLGVAHTKCQQKFDEALKNPAIKNIVVANTNTKPRDFEYYAKKAEEAGVRVVYAILEKRHDNPNVHNVPDEVLTRQHSDLMSNIKLS